MTNPPYVQAVSKAEKGIRAVLQRNHVKSLSRDELDQRVLTPTNRAAWKLPEPLTLWKFANALVAAHILSEIRLRFPSRTFVRYVWGDPTPYEVAQSLNRDGYFSHFTAMHLHGLTDQIPKTIYLNIEQHMAPGGGTLSQEAIDRVFRRPCRRSHNTASHRTLNITVLNGGNTGCAGVVNLDPAKVNAPIRITGIERTLIDAAVRPVYSGGIFEVARAYRAARGQFSVAELAKTLHTIDYTYPYHQAIGYYLEREGYPTHDVELMRSLPIEYDFYLDYGIKRLEYNSKWRLHVPKGF